MFFTKLRARMRAQSSLLCIGLDPMPDAVRGLGFGIDYFAFNRAVIDATVSAACAFKPQVAHYAASGREGDLIKTISYVHNNYPGVPVILDAKRGDIGSTSERYAVEVFERYGADAVTLNPYLGLDTFAPFQSYADRGIIGLVKTSNPGASDIQELRLQDGRPLYHRVAELLATLGPQIGFVVGATYPEDMRRLRTDFPDRTFLVPGVGAQGGDLSQVVGAGLDADDLGVVINVSRAILFSKGALKTPGRYQEIIASLALELKNQINSYRNLNRAAH